MKIHHVILFTMFAGSAVAQEVATPVARETGTTAVAAPAGEEEKGMVSIAIPRTNLTEAIETLQRTLEKTGGGRLNVIVSVPRAEEVEVPALNLRNVSGSDALQLLATSIGCELREVIRPTGGTVIGWEIRPAAKVVEHAFGGGMTGTGSSPGTAAPGFGGPRGRMILREPVMGGAGGVAVLRDTPVVGSLFGGSDGAGAPGPGPVGNNASVGGSKGSIEAGTRTEILDARTIGGGAGEGLTGSVANPNAVWVASAPFEGKTTRVYALGNLTSYAPFPEIEKSLHDVFDADGLPAADVKLTFHEKTNILIANGTDRAHALISQLIEALSRDTAVKEAQAGTERLREMKAEMEGREAAMARMQQDMERVRAQMDKSQAENNQMQAQLVQAQELVKAKEDQLKELKMRLQQEQAKKGQ